MPGTDPAPSKGTAKRTRQRGQVLAIFAGAMVLFVGILAIVVDISWYWSNTLKVQRAADAAALAGAIWLPGQQGTAYLAADNEATKNGYTAGGGVTVTPIQDSADPHQLDVTVSAPVSTFFMRLFGITHIQATRSSKAIYVLPVPMGSPVAYYGVGCFVLKSGGPPACTKSATTNGDSGVPPAPGLSGGLCNGDLCSQGGWGAILTKGANEQNGDAYAPANNGGYAPANNTKYDPNGYYYQVEVGTGGGIYVFDPGFCAMGGNGSGGTFGAGDHWVGGNTNPVSTYYTLFNTNGAPGVRGAWTQISSSGATFENETASDIANGGVATSNGTDPMTACDAFHDTWWPARTGLTAGIYEVEVQTTNPGDSTINANTNAENMFSLAVSGSGTPRVYGGGRMATYNNLSGGLQKFYLAQIDSQTGAGKTVEIDLFDPGDLAGPAFLKILNPDGGSQNYATFSYTSDGNCTGTSDSCAAGGRTQIETNNGASSGFNNTWLHILIPLPDTYGSVGTGGLWNNGWWQIEYNVIGGNDTTTWQVSVIGNPVHLVVP
jgi:hypothetical protein